MTLTVHMTETSWTILMDTTLTTPLVQSPGHVYIRSDQFRLTALQISPQITSSLMCA